MKKEFITKDLFEERMNTLRTELEGKIGLVLTCLRDYEDRWERHYLKTN